MTSDFIYRYTFEEFTPDPVYIHSQNFYATRELQKSDIQNIVYILGVYVEPAILNNTLESLSDKELTLRRKNSYSRIQFMSKIKKENFVMNGERFISLEDVV